MVKPGCPSAAPADVMVTRSDVAVPTCEAGQNATKPSIVTMSGYGGGVMGTGMGGASSTMSGTPAMFTGAASSVKAGGAMVVLGGLAALVL
jgi:hypothetical protein